MHTLDIYFTGDLVTPDGSDTGVYGDGCEVGTGAVLTIGWVDIDWARFTVHDEASAVRPVTVTGDTVAELAAAAAAAIRDRIGAIERDAGSGRYYAADAARQDVTGVTITYAAHLWMAGSMDYFPHVQVPDAWVTAVDTALAAAVTI